MFKKFSFVLPLSLCMWANQTVAQPTETDHSVSELLVTGTIIDDESVFESIPKDSLTAEKIALLQPATVIDLLRGFPGVDVAQQGGEGGLTFISIRGGDPNFTVVMIDGVKVDDPTNSRGGGYDFAGLDPLMIERIDVYSGSYSAVYGSDALGGTISVTTKSAAASGGTITAEIGTNDSRAGAFHVTGAITDSIYASAAAVTRQGSSEVDGDSIERQQLALKLNNIQTSSNDLSWAFNVFISDASATSFPYASGGDQLALVREVEDRDFDQIIAGGRVEWSPLSNWDAKLAMGWSRYEEENDSPGIAPGVLSGVPSIITDSQYDRANVTLSNSLYLSDALTIGFGGEVIREEGEIKSLIDFGFPLPANFSRNRDTTALFGEAAFSISEDVALVASLRHDDAEEITSTNGRFAININFPNTNTSASFMYAEGFKLPSLFALGHPLTGNLDLDPEESESYSINIEQPFANEKGALSLRLYSNKFKNLVDFDSDIFSHVNRSSATAKGIDVTIQVRLNDELSLSSNIGYLDTDVSDGTKLERRPEWKGNLTLLWVPSEAWLVSVRGNVNGEFYDVSVPTGEVSLDGYIDVDVSIQRALTEKVSLKLLVDNLLNSSYEESVGFSAPGRQARLAISVRL